ncbi:hypothetical protein [Marinicella meishanensis]|uniref:hypothetical protein n=1 Tax=Marinicella meishanensis TaxID=2873263 RepID=UPI001CBBBD72|nr:hypothetical protein [Marinicella sp. NBU2979]
MQRSLWVWLPVMCLLLPGWVAAMDIRLPKPAEIGPGWQGGTGVVIEDLHNPPAFFAQSMGQTIEQYRTIGVTSMANLAYRQASNLTVQVELKYFEFESAAAALAWQQKKYMYTGWKQHYTRLENDGVVIYDSTEINKRIVFLEQHWVTASVNADSKDHMMFMNHIIRQIKAHE